MIYLSRFDLKVSAGLVLVLKQGIDWDVKESTEAKLSAEMNDKFEHYNFFTDPKLVYHKDTVNFSIMQSHIPQVGKM